MPNLPPAIALIVQILAADEGRGHADTLLAIQGADPAYVRGHLGNIDAALGPASLGVASLSTLVGQAEDAVSTSSPKIVRQHVISQVVLREFVEAVPRRGRLLARYNLGSGRVDLIGTRGVGYVDNFVPVDSAATEKLWQQVEDQVKSATAAAVKHTALGDPARLSILRAAVALHFVRNPQTLDIHNKSFADAVDNYVDQVARTSLAAEAFFREHGLVAAGPEAMRLGAESVAQRLVDVHKQGGLFRLSVQRLFEKVCGRFDARGVEILTPANPAREFLLGDVAAVTIDQAGAYGLSQGVTVDEAEKIVMPLSPRLLVAIGPPDGERAVADAEVDAYNEMQVREARDYVVYRPGANFMADIAVWRI